MDRKIQWSDLPKELLATIGKRLDTRIDILRFCSVCKSWRSSIPPFNQKSPPHFHLRLPCFDSKTAYQPDLGVCVYSSLLQTTVYCLQLPTPSNSNSWLVKIEEPQVGKMQVLNPLSKCQIKNLPATFPKEFNSLEFRIIEISRSYSFEERFESILRSGAHVTGQNKAVMLSDSPWTDVADCAILTLIGDGSLHFCKHGDEKWTQVSETDLDYDDIVVYKNRFYAVDRWGMVSVLDSSLKLIKYTPPIYDGGNMKHLVVSCGNLYVVDRYLDRARENIPRAYFTYRDYFLGRGYQPNPYHPNQDTYKGKVLGFKVYKLDEELGWIEVKSLGDRVLFVGDDCSFFVSTKEFAGCKGNCIYFRDNNLTWYSDDDDALVGSTGHGFAMFNLEDGTIGKLASFPGYSQMFWPPPSWLTPNSCLPGS